MKCMSKQATKAMSIAGAALCLAVSTRAAAETPRPNILWLVSEDNMPMLGCCGDPLARTPNLDKFAAGGIRYTQAYAHSPVCAPSRFTIVTGTYACEMGTEGMRSRFPIPATIKPYPVLFREAGYYCSNDAKTDYNFKGDDKSYWDECSEKAHYRNRPAGKPFFAVFNCNLTHESSLFKPKPVTETDPAKVALPPYHPDTPEIRNKWAQYYDRVSEMDAWVGDHLRELEESGLADYTVVFYYSDHGGVLPRSKRYLHHTGTHVPLIVRFGKNVAHLAPQPPGAVSDRLVGFADLVPSVLSLAGLPIPEYARGTAFLGPQAAKPAEYVFLYRTRMDERMDYMRGITDGNHRYIRNYMPRRLLGQHVDYLWKSEAMQSWEREYKAGRCDETQSRFFQPKAVEELYGVAKDPWEVDNLANRAKFEPILRKMRAALHAKQLEIQDAGLIPEAMMGRLSWTSPVREHVVKDDFPMARLLETAEMASTAATAGDFEELKRRLSDPVPAIRYWAANGLAEMGAKARDALPELAARLADEWVDVRIAAAEALYLAGEKDASLALLLKEFLERKETWAALHAANVLSSLADKDPAVLAAVDRVRSQSKKDSGIDNILRRMFPESL